jgi:tRNA dimethylallyltransferase
MNKAVIVAGPTASGKSALAVAIALAFDGTVINADSMQVYDDLRILTARPSADDEERVPHRLYGILSPAELCSAGRWCALAAAAC